MTIMMSVYVATSLAFIALVFVPILIASRTETNSRRGQCECCISHQIEVERPLV